jgi:hypothetical protein
MEGGPETRHGWAGRGIGGEGETAEIYRILRPKHTAEICSIQNITNGKHFFSFSSCASLEVHAEESVVRVN